MKLQHKKHNIDEKNDSLFEKKHRHRNNSNNFDDCKNDKNNNNLFEKKRKRSNNSNKFDDLKNDKNKSNSDKCENNNDNCKNKLALRGPQGPRGFTGPRGHMGHTGNTGPQGTPGNNPSATMTLHVYSLLDQMIQPSAALNAPGQNVLFENIAPGTSLTTFNVSQINTTGGIIINTTGLYRIFFTIACTLITLTNPIAAISFALFLNGIIVPGGCFSTIALSPANTINYLGGVIQCNIQAGQILTLSSSSQNVVSVQAPTVGVNAQPISTSINILLLNS